MELKLVISHAAKELLKYLRTTRRYDRTSLKNFMLKL